MRTFLCSLLLLLAGCQPGDSAGVQCTLKDGTTMTGYWFYEGGVGGTNGRFVPYHNIVECKQ